MPEAPDADLDRLPRHFAISFPGASDRMEQDEEWFEFEWKGRRRRLRLHDYGSIYEVQGLYEALVYRTLKCRSPERIGGLLEEALDASECALDELRVLDLGAGNGIVAERLRRAGANEIVGVDLLPQAARAARRDRPSAYDDYVVTDLTANDSAAERRLESFAPNCLVTVAALGFGDVPPDAFRKAFDLLPEGGWVAMCIKDRFLEQDDDSGFGRLIRGLISDGRMEVLERQRYVHRLSIAGEKLFYEAFIARKGLSTPAG